MFAVEKLSSYITRGVYTVSGPFHPFGGAVDIIVVQQQDGTFKSSPWHVRFGKFQGVLKTKEKVVNICVNGVDTGFHMYLDHKGEAHFLRDTDADAEGRGIITSPVSSGDEKDERTQNGGLKKFQSCNIDRSRSDPLAQMEARDGKIVTRMRSRRSTILGLMFGQKSMKQNATDSDAERIRSLERAEIAADLLELKWSTNLPTHKRKMDQGRPPENGALHGSIVDLKQCPFLLKKDKEESFQANEMATSNGEADYIDFHGMELSDSFQSTVIREKHMKEITSLEEVVEIYAYETASTDDTSDLVPNIVEVESNGVDIHHSGPTSHAYDICTSPYDVREDGNATAGLCETMESSTMRINIAAGKGNEGVDLLSVDSVQLGEHSEVLCEKNKLMSDACSSKDNVNGFHIQNVEVFAKDSNSQSLQDAKIQLMSSQLGIIYPQAASGKFTEDGETFSENVGVSAPQIAKGEDIEPNSLDLSVQREELVESSPLVSQNTEDLQFPFSDAESSGAKETSHRAVANETDVGNRDLLLDREGNAEDGLSSINNYSVSEDYSNLSRSHNNPISILGNRASTGENKLEARSLRIICDHIHDLERSDVLHPLNSGSSMLEAEAWYNAEGRVAPELACTIPDTEQFGEQKDPSINPCVELSLCKHLLFDGMGEEAARQAFDSEKVDLEKYHALGEPFLKNDELVIRIAGRYFPWDAAASIVLGMVSLGQQQIMGLQGMIAVDRVDTNLKAVAPNAIAASGGNWSLWPFSFKKHDGADDNADSTPTSTRLPIGESNGDNAKNMKKKVWLLSPTSKELASLNLKEGQNVVTFSFSTARLGRQQVDARIYLWKWNTRIVISDVDGTITKSDVLGQFMPLVGVDWSQTGVARLYSSIKENGYQLLFLSARAISQAHLTRQFLFNLKQDGKALPDGPVVISPDGLFPSLYREVIRRAPHEFKISCLEAIKALFPPDCNPFYAGFGNRDTDELSYLKVGIPIGKIFIINPRGEVAVNRRVDTRSYSSLHALVNGVFPPMSSSEQEDYNSWNYWKLPLPDIGL